MVFIQCNSIQEVGTGEGIVMPKEKVVKVGWYKIVGRQKEKN